MFNGVGCVTCDCSSCLIINECVRFAQPMQNWDFLKVGFHSTSVRLSMLLFQRCCTVGWGCRIHRLLLCREIRPPPYNKCPVYDTNQSDGEVPLMLELWRMPSTSSLPSPRVVAPNRVLSIGQTELNCVLILN